LARVALVLIPLLVILPGCLSAGPQACQGEACDAPPTTPRFITRPPGVDFPPLPEEEALRSIRLADCHGLVATLELPYDLVRATVPSEFELREIIPGTAVVLVLSLECQRAIFGQRIVETYRELHVLAGAYPRNATWAAGGVSFYVLDHMVSNEAAVDALESWGLRAAMATLTLSDHPVPSLEGHAWHAQAASLTLEFEYGLYEPSQALRNATNYYWAGSGPFLRTVHYRNYTFDDLYQGGIVRSEGSATTAQLMPAGSWPWQGSPLRTFSSAGFVDLELFGT
jgi:hypothetical protein